MVTLRFTPCQVTLASALRCYEDGRWPLRTWDGCGPCSQALRRKAEKRLARGWAASAGLYLYLVQSDFLCDVFLSLRVLFLAYMVMCSEMITTWVPPLPPLLLSPPPLSHFQCHMF